MHEHLCVSALNIRASATKQPTVSASKSRSSCAMQAENARHCHRFSVLGTAADLFGYRLKQAVTDPEGGEYGRYKCDYINLQRENSKQKGQ